MKAIKNIQRGLRRFHRDQGGQAVLFGAASMVVLISFAALVFNTGNLVSRRIQTQLGADAMTYSGAVLQANALSAIGWINSGMAQVYARAMQYAVDVCATGLAAGLQDLQPEDQRNASAYTAHDEAVRIAREGLYGADGKDGPLPGAVNYIASLSKIQNALAIITPDLAWEEMYAIGKQHGIERIALFPYQRMFPHEGGDRHYMIRQFGGGTGWQITNLDADDGQSITVSLFPGPKWTISYSAEGLVQYRWVIEKVSDDKWVIRRLDRNGVEREYYELEKCDNVWTVTSDRGVQIRSFSASQDPSDINNDRTAPRRGPCTMITADGKTEYFRHQGGVLYAWNRDDRQWVSQTVETATVGKYTVNVYTSNHIRVGNMTVAVGATPTVWIGNCRITLNSSSNPYIAVNAGPLTIGVHGASISVAVNGHTLDTGSADGRWRMHFSNDAKLWWRHRLTSLVPDPQTISVFNPNTSAYEIQDVEYQWQYDYQTLGALLRYEDNATRFVCEHALRDQAAYQGGAALPAWLDWYAPTGWGRVTDGAGEYTLSEACKHCNGTGQITNPDGSTAACSHCQGSGTLGLSLADVINSWSQDKRDLASPRPFLDPTVRPLVLTEDFFRWGITAGAWRPAEAAPMLFNREPNWGYVAVSCARVGVPDVDPWTGETRYRYRFYDIDAPLRAEYREKWVEDRPENLYRADLRAKLVSSRTQMDQVDIEENTIVGVPLTTEPESATSFLWNVLINGRYSGLDEASLWFSEPNGQSDFDMSARLQNMRNRAGNVFRLNSNELGNVVRH